MAWETKIFSLPAFLTERRRKDQGSSLSLNSSYFAPTPTSQESSASETENAAGTSLLNATLKHLLSICHAKDKAVRFRACQAVSKLLNALDEEAEVDDDMWELLQETMLRRMTDKIPVVRVQAINALTRLQEPTDMDCPVIQAYLQRMECDSSPGTDGRATIIYGRWSFCSGCNR